MVPSFIYSGLATYGTVARGLSQALLDNDHTRIKSYETKFVGHVFPGETLKVKVWNTGADQRYFEVETVERGKKTVQGVLTIR
jgi:acyl dehydratase